MSGFASAIAGGVGTLIRTFLQSQGFVSGSTGWQIRKDGGAEFNNIVIRNGQVISGQALFYSGTPALGNLIASISGTAGFDSFGNRIPQGITAQAANGALISLIPGAPSPTLQFVDSSGLNVAQIVQDIPSVGIDNIHFGNVTNVWVDSGGLITSLPHKVIDPVAGFPTVETWHNLSLSGGYTNQGAPQPTSSYRMTNDLEVELVGAITGGASFADGTTVATLPAGYRPGHTITNVIYVTTGAAEQAAMNVDSSGNCKIFGCGSNVINFHFTVPLDL